MASLAAANAEFGFDLFREMDSSQGNGNVFFSSLSIFTALSLIRLGARGDCARQIDKVSVTCPNQFLEQTVFSMRIFHDKHWALPPVLGFQLEGSRNES